MLKPYFSPREKNNPYFEQYMRQTLLAYKPFCKKEEITNLDDKELKEEFIRFRKSEICPTFVEKAYEKANEKKKKKTKNGSHDEVEEKALDNSDSDGQSDDNDVQNVVPIPNPEKEGVLSHDQTPGPPPIAKFTEAYQEYGHMAPKGLDYEGTDIATFDDDNDVVE